ncbi:hypothetical protein ACH3VR_15410 [Microbacterium sp. B2969]|uniref:Secreted protein n=1 Tax=Microbacterium alkaliflavum TaxID=3248839 RepID=A0ABW7QA52_9MICO
MNRRAAVGTAAITFTIALAVGAAAPAFATSPVDGDHRVPYCHATHSETNPYVFIETDKYAVVRAHAKHQDLEDVYPGFWYDDHGTPTWMDGRGDAAFAENGCTSGGIG